MANRSLSYPGAHVAVPEPAEPSAEMTELLAAVTERFPEPPYTVTCDHNTVWIKTAGGSRTVGLNLWLLRMHTLSEMFDRAEAKLAPTKAKGKRA